MKNINRTVKRAGACCIVVGIVSIIAGVACGVMSIISGGLLLSKKTEDR